MSNAACSERLLEISLLEPRNKNEICTSGHQREFLARLCREKGCWQAFSIDLW